MIDDYENIPDDEKFTALMCGTFIVRLDRQTGEKTVMSKLPPAEPSDEERHELTMEVLNDPCSWPVLRPIGRSGPVLMIQTKLDELHKQIAESCAKPKFLEYE